MNGEGLAPAAVWPRLYRAATPPILAWAGQLVAADVLPALAQAATSSGVELGLLARTAVGYGTWTSHHPVLAWATSGSLALAAGAVVGFGPAHFRVPIVAAHGAYVGWIAAALFSIYAALVGQGVS